MPRIIPPLSDTQIKNSKPKDKEYTLQDGKGLYILVTPVKTKLWRYQYTFEKKRYLMSLGAYPTISLQKAREIREKYIIDISNGINPAISKNTNSQKAISKEDFKPFSVVCLEWLEFDTTTRNLTSKHSKRKIQLFENYIIPFFGASKDISKITPEDIEKMLYQKSQTANETSHRIYQMMTKLYSYSLYKKYTTVNTMLLVPKEYILKPVQKEHFKKIVDDTTLKELLNAIDNYKGWVSVKVSLQIVCHIPLRAENLCSLKWKQIDFDKKTITIPRSEMKIKNKNLDDFIIPMSSEVEKILKEFKKEFGFYEWVFVSPTLRTHINTETPNKALKTMGFNDDKYQRLHGFRGTFRSLCDTHQNKHNATFETKERTLDHHEKSQVVRAYSNKAVFTEQIRELLEWWSCYLLKLKGANYKEQSPL